MARILLWTYFITTMLIHFAAYYVGERLETSEYNKAWIAIAILALCESIEVKKVKQ